eukprot:12107524-Alexandrium_andersonii.AAC.1
MPFSTKPRKLAHSWPKGACDCCKSVRRVGNARCAAFDLLVKYCKCGVVWGCLLYALEVPRLLF